VGVSGECNVCGRTGCVETNHPATPAERLRACPHYEQLPEGCDALVHTEIDRRLGRPAPDPETCGGCGGDTRDGPSCICPVYGEVDE
jgi:hypothetical protein